MPRIEQLYGNTSSRAVKRTLVLLALALFVSISGWATAGRVGQMLVGIGAIALPVVLRCVLVAMPNLTARGLKWFGWAVVVVLVVCVVLTNRFEWASGDWYGALFVGLVGLYASAYFVFFSDAEIVAYDDNDVRRKRRRAPDDTTGPRSTSAPER